MIDKNPWEKISLDVYEKHMTSKNVFQIQVLQKIMKEQFTDNCSEIVGICGVAGGNGISELDWQQTKKLYAMDINQTYLKACKNRFLNYGKKIDFLQVDFLNTDFKLPKTTLLVCNLIIEYLGIEQFCQLLKRSKEKKYISCVIQKNNQNNFVSTSSLEKYFNVLETIECQIDSEKLKENMLLLNAECIKEKNYILPNGKEFIRQDYVFNN